MTNGGLGLHGVAGVIQRRGEGAHAEDAGHDADDGAAHAGFRRQARFVEPVAGVLVEAHGGHERDNLRRKCRVEHALLRQRVHAVIGDGGCGNGQLLGGDAQGALAGVQIERHHGIVVNAVVFLQQPRDGAVVEIGGRLGVVQLVDEYRLAAQQIGHVVEDGLPFRVGVSLRLHQRAGGNGAGVHQRGGGAIVLQQDGEDGVEGKAGGVGADLVEHRFRAQLLQHEDGRVHLRD